MKKIKLDSAKLVLKKQIIGNLTNKEMANVAGGETGVGACQDYTLNGYTCNSANNYTDCGGPFPSAGCDPSAACGSGPYCTVHSMPPQCGGTAVSRPHAVCTIQGY